MNKIGILGGLSPESTQLYYSEIVKKYLARSNGQFPEIIIYSVNLAECKAYLENKKPDTLAKVLSNAVDSLVKAGADFVAMASNTPHIVFDQVNQEAKVPMISIVKESAKYANKISSSKKIGLLGTGFTMKANFFAEEYEKHGLNLFVPNEIDQNYIHEKIFSELTSGIVKEETRNKFFDITKSIKEKYEIDSLVLGCTELPLIFDNEYPGIQYVDTAEIHINSIIDFCFNNPS